MNPYYTPNENIFEYTIIKPASVECKARMIIFTKAYKFTKDEIQKLCEFLNHNQFMYSPNSYDIHIPNDEEMTRFKLLWELS